jgi:hypothetical protein
MKVKEENFSFFRNRIFLLLDSSFINRHLSYVSALGYTQIKAGLLLVFWALFGKILETW